MVVSETTYSAAVAAKGNDVDLQRDALEVTDHSV